MEGIPETIKTRSDTARSVHRHCTAHENHDSGNNCANLAIAWRRGRDSNPRWVSAHTRFPSALLRPLGHLSQSCATALSGGDRSALFRHPSPLLPLLPSRPDGVHNLSSRRGRAEPPLDCINAVLRIIDGLRGSSRVEWVWHVSIALYEFNHSVVGDHSSGLLEVEREYFRSKFRSW